uniref:Uncharacterized protein n=1 Tax=Fibrocapsa japonica TaxID=94617 RepID=A0A7S2XUD1_9STRA|mmetsp:Transcript_12845/g.18956  ORF Transcript_12845/g.18956 Transcript_12845/m.18956 type:complete len:256 (+) Transcript_12845:84-851(+)|eukprot:CAMPEP_0113944822 /NCGR_PEP_ID=MMETSP1339-20121228/37112_1 /TAXON_ID=94617 /ORGANISM="Fibrocapsa japonica" /LENGTH=255 /DNA_ID=CAMNT_0000950153 /DNA_START=72 /DNA_END=839 /DNA_ORIENTATION=- /assembly_acc=CAM_ASM_000762
MAMAKITILATLMVASAPQIAAFISPQLQYRTAPRLHPLPGQSLKMSHDDESSINGVREAVLATALAGAVLSMGSITDVSPSEWTFKPPSSHAAMERTMSEFGSQMQRGEQGESGQSVSVGTVSEAIEALKSSEGPRQISNALEGIYNLIQDEDGPLVETADKKLVVQKVREKKASSQAVWTAENEIEFSVIKRKLDPYNTVVLGPYLKVAPFVGGAIYLALIWVQQSLPRVFDYAYIVGALAFAAPIFIIALKG